MFQVNRLLRWGIAFLGLLAIIVFMNSRFVHSMIYPAPSVRVPAQPPTSFEQPNWDLEMHGWLHTPSGTATAKQMILYFHGNGENLETMRQSGLLEELKTFGIPFLVVDYPGYGLSKGRASEKSILQDSIQAAKWMKNRFQDHALIVCGWSLGASVAVQTAAKSDDADALIAMSAWTSLRDIAALHFSPWLTGLVLKDRYDALEAARTIRLPALLIHGELDDLIPVEQGKKVSEAIPGNVRWVPVPSVSHNDLLSEPIVWTEIRRFLQQLRKSD